MTDDNYEGTPDLDLGALLGEEGFDRIPDDWGSGEYDDSLGESYEFVCTSCFLLTNRYTSPDGKRCPGCVEREAPVRWSRGFRRAGDRPKWMLNILEGRPNDEKPWLCVHCALTTEEDEPKAGPHRCGANKGNPVAPREPQRVVQQRPKLEIPDDVLRTVMREARQAAKSVFAKTAPGAREKDHYYSVADLENHSLARLLSQPKVMDRFIRGEITELKLRDYLIRYGHELVTKLRDQRAYTLDSDAWNADGVVDNFLSAERVRAYLSYGIFDPVVFEALTEVHLNTSSDSDLVFPEDLSPTRLVEFQLVYDSLRSSYQEIIFRAYALGQQLSHAQEQKLSRAVLAMEKKLNRRAQSSVQYSLKAKEYRHGAGPVPTPVEQVPRAHTDHSTWKRPTVRDIEWIRETRRGNERNRRLKVRSCAACGSEFEHGGGRGRPPKYCPECRS